MKIGIDLRLVVLGASGGISQLVKGVCEHMFAQHPEHQFLVFCTPFNRSLLDYDAAHVRFYSLPIPTFFREVDQLAVDESIQVLFRTYPMEDNLQFPNGKQIFLIPDIQHETFPEFFSSDILRTRRAAFSRALAKAGAIGTISDYARKTLIEFPKTKCQDIFLMPPALQAVHKAGEVQGALTASERKLIPESDFFLFPANLWKHKNHLRLLQAFRKFTEDSGRHNISLVLTGHPSGWPEIEKGFSDLPVTHLGFVRPELLRALLERAQALVFFSLYEGFGMPLLEAFDAGTPVICSNTTSLPEVGGDAILTCDPKDVTAIATLMKHIIADDELRAKLVCHGKKRLKAFAWGDSAEQLVAACQRVVKATENSHESHRLIPETMPLVSIVTPSYNQGRFIKKTIESVLSQNYPNIEYVVIDGGSSDQTVDILRSYGDRLEWVSEPDRGQTDAINKGMARVQGEILAYLNSDDVLAPGAIERIVNYFKSNPDCDMVYGNADYIDEDDKVTGKYDTDQYSFDRLLEDCMVCQPAAFWRRRIAEKVGPFDDQLNYAMDYDYWLRMAKAGGKICFLPQKLACSRLYPETKTQSERTKIFKEIFRICKKNAGFIHTNYYCGYWHHLIHEKNTITSRLLNRFSGLYTKLGWLHHKWDHRTYYSMRHIAGLFIRRVKNRLRRHSPADLKSRSGRILPSPAFLRSLLKGKSVFGFESDNWLGPTVAVAPSERVCGHSLHIAGIAPVDQVMSVISGEKEVFAFTFEKQQYKKVTFPSEAIGNKQLTLQFSEFTEDISKRRLSFLLQDTNIFTEEDTL
ncbi:MAG: glycosyltransferase [Desulfobacterales bacterium]|nr:glycosyltransferase [Desulfobacterales bacterium]